MSAGFDREAAHQTVLDARHRDGAGSVWVGAYEEGLDAIDNAERRAEAAEVLGGRLAKELAQAEALLEEAVACTGPAITVIAEASERIKGRYDAHEGLRRFRRKARAFLAGETP